MTISRRDLLAATAASAAIPAAAHATTWVSTWHPIDATELADKIRRKEMTSLEAVEAAIARAESLQPSLNFMVNSMFDRALDQAKAGTAAGPFAGVPFLVKDLNDVKGVPTRQGSRVNMDDPPAAGQAPYINAFEAAGLVFIGKSASPEYGFLPTTEPVAFGPTRNPWNLDHSTGGSSGGAAAAVAAGIVPLAHASDGGGSIRIPSSCCGLFGLKPSRGRMISSGPPMKPIDLGVEHCVSRSVRDSAGLFAATEMRGAGAAFPPVGVVTGPNKRRLRVGFVTESATGRAPDPDVRSGAEATAKLLAHLGHHVEPTHWPIDGGAFGEAFLTAWAAGADELVQGVAKAIDGKPDDTLLEPFTLGMAQAYAKLPAGAAEKAVKDLEAAGRAYDTWFEKYDVILSPVLAKPPVRLGVLAPTVPLATLYERLIEYAAYTPLHNVAGAPAMSVPMFWTADGLPVGMQFGARIGRERMLFELAFELEAAQPWQYFRPPVWAA